MVKVMIIDGEHHVCKSVQCNLGPYLSGHYPIDPLCAQFTPDRVAMYIVAI